MLKGRPLKKKLLASKDKKQREIKEIAIYERPEKLKLLLNNLTWKILLLLSKKEMYPMEVAKKLDIHEQKIYYHIRKLAKAGAIRKVKEEERKGNGKREGKGKERKRKGKGKGTATVKRQR